MSEVRHINEAKNSKKKKRRIRTDIDFEMRSPAAKRALLIVLTLLILTFCVYQVYSFRSRHVSAKTETALSRTISKTISTDGYIIREESIISYSAGGTVVPVTANGSKVGIGDAVAKIYNSSDTAEKSMEYAYLKSELDYYKSIDLVSGSVLSVGMEIYNSNILSSLLDLETSLNGNTLSELPEKVRALSSSITKKQAAVGKTIDVSAEIASVTARLETLETQLSGCTEVTAQAAGYYVNETDGYEGAGDYSTVTGITAGEVSGLLNASPVKVQKNVGKLITQFAWYLVCNVAESDADSLSVGDNVKIFFEDSSDAELTMKLKAKNESEENVTALVFMSELMDSNLASLRKERIKIRVEEYSGYAVNRKAVRTVKNKDGEDEIGVFIQLGNIARFRKIDIIYSDDNIVLASGAEDKNGYLKLYDEIIIEGTDLYDGKIIS